MTWKISLFYLLKPRLRQILLCKFNPDIASTHAFTINGMCCMKGIKFKQQIKWQIQAQQ
jgi:hypothetical protein